MTWNGKLGFETQPSTPINITMPDLMYADVFASNGYKGLDGPQGIMGIQVSRIKEISTSTFKLFLRVKFEWEADKCR